MENSFNITRKDETLTWQTIIERISLGFELQNIRGEITEDQILAFNDAIVIAPDYQREYRSSVSDESSLIESALLEIPIPPIFLASHKYKGIQVLNVVDGQHRLRAFYRYFNNEYALKDLKILTDFNGKAMKDVAVENKVKLMSRTVNAITFRDFPGKQFELEIFNHYNKGTNVFENKDVAIESGQKVGLIGFSGSGKTTFVNLILRFFDVESGKITIDGRILLKLRKILCVRIYQ